MKKAYRLASLMLVIALTFIINCTNLTDDATITGEGLKNPVALTVVATGSVSSVTFPTIGKQILPASLNGNNLYFYMWGDDRLDVTKHVAPRNLQFYASSGTNGRTGSVELMDLDKSQYELYLVATNTPVAAAATDLQTIEQIMNSAVLYATSIVDMRYNQRVSFYLTPYNLDGYGNVSLKVYYYSQNLDGTLSPLETPYTNNNGVSFGIYDINDDSQIQGRKTPAVLQTSTFQYLSASQIADMNCVEPASPNYEWYSIKSGTYVFKAIFYDTVHNKQYIYSDTILILTNQTTEATVIIGDIIGKYPNQPIDFTVKYADTNSIGSGYYDAAFQWTDTSNNEQYFRLELLDISGIKTATYEGYIDTVTAADGCIAKSLVNNKLELEPVSDALNNAANTNWENLVAYLGASCITSLTYEVRGKPEYWLSGSLHSGSQNLVIKLPLGSRYLARLCAVNDAGDSAFTYCGIGRADVNDALAVPPVTNAITPVPYTKNGAAGSITPQKFPDGARCINRFVINYNFVSDAGGTRGEATYYHTQYDASGKISKITSKKADKQNVTTLAGDLHSDVRYYTQKSGGNEILNPLKVANENILNNIAYPFYSLARSGNSWTAWKVDSEYGTTVFETKVSPIPEPEQVLSDTTAGQTLGYNSPYTGFNNINLFATYNAVVVELYSPADDDILDDDVLIIKSKNPSSTIISSDVVQVATINKARSFTLNDDVNNGYRNLFIGLRNGKYDKVELCIETVHGDLKSTYTGTKTQNFNVPRYILTTSEPVDWATNYGDYFTKEGHYYAAITATDPVWEPLKYYRLEKDGSTAESFTYFQFDTMQFGSQNLVFRIKGYSPKAEAEPFSYPMTIAFNDKSTYSVTLFEPLNFATNYAKYFKYDAGTSSYIQNDITTWSPGTIFQEN